MYAGYQIVPAEALLSDPFGSVWNLHIQPPTWNLLLGVIGGWSPLSLTVSYSMMSLAWGVVLAGSLCSTLSHLGASRAWAVGLSLLGSLTTQILVHAFEPRYDLAVAAMLSLLVWSVARSEAESTRGMLLGPTLVATLLVSTRTLYHPVWLIGVMVIVGWSFRASVTRREVIAAIAIPVVALGAVMVKNQAVVGEFTLSTLTGMNMERSVSPAASDAVLRAMTNDGEISEIWDKGLAGWALEQPCDVRPTEHEVLRAPYRTLPPQWQTGPFDDGVVPNYNARCFLPAYRQAATDARRIVVEHPGVWVRGRVWAVNNWFGVIEPNPPETSPLWKPMNVASRIVLIGVPHPPLPSSWENESLWVQSSPVSLLLVLLTIVVVGASVRRVRCLLRHPRSSTVAIVLTGWLVLWTIAVGVVFELGEQVRFRNAIDPLVIAIGGWLAVEFARSRRAEARHNTHTTTRSATTDSGS